MSAIPAPARATEEVLPATPAWLSRQTVALRAPSVTVSLEAVSIPVHEPLDMYVALRRERAEDDVFLFESPDGPDQDARSAVVGWGRLAELRIFENHVTISGTEGLSAAFGMVASEVGLISQQEGRWEARNTEMIWEFVRSVQSSFIVKTDMPPDTFTFGFLTAFSYGAAWAMDALPPRPVASAVPWCTLTVFRDTIWYDMVEAQVRHLVATSPVFPPADSPDMAEMAAVLAKAAPAEPLPAAPVPRSVGRPVDEATFVRRARRCLEHIRIGDVYQIQIGHQINVETDLTPLDAYRRLRHRNPSPYMYLAPWAGHVLVGASPELFFRISDGQIIMRPIAGTRARGRNEEDNTRRVAKLRSDEKERAEHVMLVDLCRNDIGRVCRPGSLSVDQMMAVERFSHVFHLVSTVSGRLAQDVDVWGVLCATFPAGTMTGAPKLRAMEIIQEIEGDDRGIYAGAVGLIDARGYGNLALCIRTAVHDGTRFSIRASAGIVADSLPEAEWRETLAKMGATYWALTGEELLA